MSTTNGPSPGRRFLVLAAVTSVAIIAATLLVLRALDGAPEVAASVERAGSPVMAHGEPASPGGPGAPSPVARGVDPQAALATEPAADPEAHADEARSDDLVLTAGEVRFRGEPVVQVRDLLRDEYFNIPPLEAALGELEAEHPGANPCAGIHLDAAVSWRVVRRILFTCARAGHLAAFVLPDGTSIAAPSAQHREHRLFVAMAADGFRVQDARWSKRFLSEDARPIDALLKWLEPNTALVLKPDDDVPAALVLQTYETLRLAGHRAALN